MLTLAAAATAVTAAPRIAMVDVKSVYNQLPSTTALQKEIADRQSAILLDHRAEALRKAIADLQSLDSQLRDKSGPLTDEAKQKLARSYELKRQEALTMQQEFEKFRADENKAINREMIAAMRRSLDRIVAASARIGAEQGFDSIFDISGETNTGVPFILYSKNTTDLTPTVLAALMATEPAPPTAAEPAAAEPDAAEPAAADSELQDAIPANPKP